MSTEQTEQPETGQPAPENPEEAHKAEQRARPRLRELLAIPERDRSDAVWDEIIELEISLAPGNRAAGAQGDGGRRHDPGRGPQQAQGGGRPGRGAFKKSRRRRGG
ncbi:MAG TPA: hypothetical protein VLX30_00425 [Burkholderiales bacterium]|nr:hypothetical protein [Burkholderiales bacterium]